MADNPGKIGIFYRETRGNKSGKSVETLVSSKSCTSREKVCHHLLGALLIFSKPLKSHDGADDTCGNHAYVLFICFLAGMIKAQNVKPLTIDVTEGEDVRLECRFSSQLSKKASTLYWIRTNRRGHDNVAIGDTPFQANYM